MRSCFSLALVALLVGPAHVRAQDTTRLTVDSVASGIVRAPLVVDGSRIRAGERRYEVVVTNDSGPRLVGTHTITVTEGMHGGQPAWQLAEFRESQAPFPSMSALDTTVVGRASLSPLRWDATMAGGRFVAAIANDTLYGGASGHGIRRTFTVPLAPLTVTSEGALDVMLQGVALFPGWVADAAMVVVDLNGPRLLALRLQVEREERVVVPAGEFDAWAVRASTAGADKWYWVDKLTGVVVKTAQRPVHLPGMLLERALVPAAAVGSP